MLKEISEMEYSTRLIDKLKVNNMETSQGICSFCTNYHKKCSELKSNPNLLDKKSQAVISNPSRMNKISEMDCSRINLQKDTSTDTDYASKKASDVLACSRVCFSCKHDSSMQELKHNNCKKSSDSPDKCNYRNEKRLSEMLPCYSASAICCSCCCRCCYFCACAVRGDDTNSAVNANDTVQLVDVNTHKQYGGDSLFSIRKSPHTIMRNGPCRRKEKPDAFPFQFKRFTNLWLLLFLALITVMTPAKVSADTLSPSNAVFLKNETKVCRDSIDIRNIPAQFEKLRGCRVVEGSVQILLFDNSKDPDYTRFTFPELVEITDYLMLYRVSGLKTLAHIFPNLAVIRGHNLLNNNALVIYEMMDMTEIGLYSLTDIVRGAIRIEKNPMLCHVHTIDWSLIARGDFKEENFIKLNKDESQCGRCPGDDKNQQHDPNQEQCPEAKKEHKLQKKVNRLCWNRHHCQKVCPKECNHSCNENRQCCHETCLGGCANDNINSCTVCRAFSMGDGTQRQCVTKCPTPTFEYLSRRCVFEEECYAFKNPAAMDYSDNPYRPFQGKCDTFCPINFTDKVLADGKHTCVECAKDNCRKDCDGGVVNSVLSAKKLRGCTHIKNSLQIQISGSPNTVKELEENLAMIQEIDGHLKIVRSFPLVSLSFLKSLKAIRGNTIENTTDNYSFIVMDNPNLQFLWNWTTHGPINISKGLLSFHYNPKLCMYNIDPLKQMAAQSTFSLLEVDVNSNGDRFACNVTDLHVNVNVKPGVSTAAILTWTPYVYEDPRSLLGYVVYSMKSAHQNVTLYDGRDACGGDGWNVDDVPVGKGTVFHILTHLEPYTQYAFYVKTYTLSSERISAQSPILYFTTNAAQPTVPRQLESFPESNSELMLTWNPPQKPNGNVTHYIITGKWEKDVLEVAKDRDYCDDPIVEEKIPQKPIPDIPVKEKPTPRPEDDLEHCKCRSGSKERINEDEVEYQNTFEDIIQNQVFIKNSLYTSERNRRSLMSEFVSSMKHKRSTPESLTTVDAGIKENSSSSTTISNRRTSIEDILTTEVPPEKYENSKEKFFYKVNTTTFTIRDLHHYARYVISVEACREREPKDTNTSELCSMRAIITQRTLKLDGADEVRNFKYEQKSNKSEVRLSWDEPLDPNGLILTYQIEYKVDIKDVNPNTVCISRQRYLEANKTYTLTGLLPGNYTIKIKASSMAGSSNFTPPKNFIIPDTSSHKSLQMVVGSICGTLLMAFLLVAIGWYLKRKYMPPVSSSKLFASVNPEYHSMQYQPDEWELPREDIDLVRELGQGSFGMVYEGVARNVLKNAPEMRCAIKTVNEHATDRERIEFLNEASVMKAFDTAHVVRLLGVVSKGQPTLVVMELMANGDLKSYLRLHRPDEDNFDANVCLQPPTLKRILQMAIEIADGMAYLSAKKFVHRDLAARNCMVADDLTVKIGDFGMTRDIYETDYYRKGTKGLLPVRWMAPESLKDGVFTSSSDVWSYGVVLWEMATLASQPYQGLSNDQVLRYVIDGGVMERPENCPDQLYELMRLTWQHKPLSRPSFLELEAMLHADDNPEFRKISFFHSPHGQEIFGAIQSTITASDDVTAPLRQPLDHDFSHSDGEAEDQAFQAAEFLSGEGLKSSSGHSIIFGEGIGTNIGSYRDSLSYIGSTPGTSYGKKEKDHPYKDKVSVYGSRSPGFYSLAKSSNASPQSTLYATKNEKDSSLKDIDSAALSKEFNDETNYPITAPILSTANGYIPNIVKSNNGSANVKTTEC